MSLSNTSQNVDWSPSIPQGQERELLDLPDINLTRHALNRMDGRRIPIHAVEVVLAYGRKAWTRGSQIFALGRREVQRASLHGLNLLPYEGIQVVCTPDGRILTVYRNRDFTSLRKSASGNQAASQNQRSRSSRNLPRLAVNTHTRC